MKHIALLLPLILSLTSCANANDPDNPYSGKTFSVLGDSYSTFIDAVSPDTNYVWYTPQELEHNCTDVNDVSQIWWHILANNLHMTLLQNNSFSGSTISYHGYDNADYSDRSFITRAPNLPASDVILIFGGTNDSWSGAPAGTYDYQSFPTDSLYTFRPAMALLLKQLKELQPNAEIFTIINSELRNDITESIMAISDHYGAHFINLYDINKQCGHPTRAGQAAIAREVAAYLLH